MNKKTFLDTLEKGLKFNQIRDVEEIIEDYTEHFDQQTSLGKKEEDISASLGTIDSIVSEYSDDQLGKRNRFFEWVTVSFVAIPILILSVGLLIVFAATSLACWGISIYYAFNLDTFKFMPLIPFIPRLFYIASMFFAALFMFSLSVRFYGVLKSMTKQFIVKKSIRIGNFLPSPFYKKLLIYSFWIMLILVVAAFVVSVIFANSFEYWHTWGWFQSTSS